MIVRVMLCSVVALDLCMPMCELCVICIYIYTYICICVYVYVYVLNDTRLQSCSLVISTNTRFLIAGCREGDVLFRWRAIPLFIRCGRRNSRTPVDSAAAGPLNGY